MIGRTIANFKLERCSPAPTRPKTAIRTSKRFSHHQTKLAYDNSPVQTINIGSHHKVHVKRDDLLGEAGTGGNKARKLAGFRQMLNKSSSQQSPFNTIASTGGCQSNAMLAIAHFAKEHDLEFHFFCPPVSSTARSEAHGNLASSLALGMHLHESINPESSLETWKADSNRPELLVVPRGVSCDLAEVGLQQLAEEIDAHFQTIRTPKTRSMLVFLPSGTGTTATFLNKHLQLLSKRDQPYEVDTLGVSVAMKPSDLLSQIKAQYPNEPGKYPNFIHPSKKRIHFARPNPHVKAIWCAMKRKGLVLDLIYGPVAWMSLFEILPSIDSETCEVYYIHTGGLTGNGTQLHRYNKLESCPVPQSSL